ncbi:uncharacterized protein GLRG_11264 [Colletotrichum graminicola M1.001]|uniref:Uncharacterized protein n=1 Tax=Colletotrichum graminicola (strain M1.001 / M2 / FGSC 10212) TaxID=645133 RepID=E3QZ32_COLGM|nr:uncharacterized protein GLRG_11264 [Colletotrichum graminicola M1.001]EFQ36120.1 hypothetical protein GLRG_11264 [Colletotrichum graminicola M1.001]
MAPQQNTFAVIPAAPGRVGGAPSKPPMTSKQAQKLYKQANKEPRRSKAEQRRWEKERQEDIRKELEKERAAAKARAARERKKAKEEEARKSRRRAGQPLFDCRPSQDTIARFVRGNGTSRKRDSSGEPVPKDEDTPASSLENKPKLSLAPSAARAASSVSCPPPTPPERPKPLAISMAPPPGASQKSRTVNKPPQSLPNPPNQPPSWDIPPPPMQHSKDGPAVLPSSLLKVVDSSNHVPDKTLAVPVSMDPPLRPPLKSKSKPFMMPRVSLPVQQPSGREVFKPNPTSKSTPISPLSGPLLQHKLSLPDPASQGEPPQMPTPQVPSQKPPPQSTVPTPLLKSLSKDSTSQKLSVQTPPLSRPQPQAPPPSTQAIVQDCFDDFFPTASQLAMELEQDSDSDTQPGEVLDQQSNDPLAAKVGHGELVDLMMSSQEVLDIESTTKNTTQSFSSQSPFLEMDLAAIDWDDDLDDF